MTATAGYLFEGADWDFTKLQHIHDACEEIARSELGLEIYPNQNVVVSLPAGCSHPAGFAAARLRQA